MLTQEKLKEYLYYNSETGVFTWIKLSGRRARVGDIAGSNCNGYLTLNFNGRKYYAHRLAWFYMYGYWPAFEIDHINRVKSDNRSCNLRESTRSQNLQNSQISIDNLSGHKGINWEPDRNKWLVRICINGKSHHIGRFNTMEDAIRAYTTKAKQLQQQYYPGDDAI